VLEIVIFDDKSLLEGEWVGVGGGMWRRGMMVVGSFFTQKFFL
jgi:hypothetical protein